MIGLQVAEGDGADDVVGLERRPVAALDADLAVAGRDAAAAGVHLDDLLGKKDLILDGVKFLREHVLWTVLIKFNTCALGAVVPEVSFFLIQQHSLTEQT